MLGWKGWEVQKGQGVGGWGERDEGGGGGGGLFSIGLAGGGR